MSIWRRKNNFVNNSLFVVWFSVPCSQSFVPSSSISQKVHASWRWFILRNFPENLCCIFRHKTLSAYSREFSLLFLIVLSRAQNTLLLHLSPDSLWTRNYWSKIVNSFVSIILSPLFCFCTFFFPLSFFQKLDFSEVAFFLFQGDPFLSLFRTFLPLVVFC